VPLDSLNLMQRMQVEYFLDKKSHADPKKIREFLEKVGYPVCFLDFETFASAIPLFDGTRPYQQVPFQYSLHRIDAEGETPAHFEYLAQPGPDPRKEIAEKLLGEIPEGACVLVYSIAVQVAAGLLPAGHPGPRPAAGEDAVDHWSKLSTARADCSPGSWKLVDGQPYRWYLSPELFGPNNPSKEL
jgi:hypothetical protein